VKKGVWNFSRDQEKNCILRTYIPVPYTPHLWLNTHICTLNHQQLLKTTTFSYLQLTGNDRFVPPKGRFWDQVMPSSGSIFLCTIKISPSDVVLTPSKTIHMPKYSVVPPSDTKYSVQLPKYLVLLPSKR